MPENKKPLDAYYGEPFPGFSLKKIKDKFSEKSGEKWREWLDKKWEQQQRPWIGKSQYPEHLGKIDFTEHPGQEEQTGDSANPWAESANLFPRHKERLR